jgi:hypothetical protein
MLDSSKPNLHNHLNNKALFLSLRDPIPRPLMLPIFWGSPYKKRGKEKKYKKIIGRKQKKQGKIKKEKGKTMEKQTRKTDKK